MWGPILQSQGECFPANFRVTRQCGIGETHASPFVVTSVKTIHDAGGGLKPQGFQEDPLNYDGAHRDLPTGVADVSLQTTGMKNLVAPESFQSSLSDPFELRRSFRDEQHQGKLIVAALLCLTE